MLQIAKPGTEFVPQSPASVCHLELTACSSRLRRAVVQTAGAKELWGQSETIQALSLRNRNHSGHEVLVWTRGNIKRQEVQFVVPAHVGPSLSFHEQRIAL